MAITFFKTPKNKKYSYKPVFYDPRKEEREKRLTTAFTDQSQDYEDALRERMRIRWKRSAGAREKRASKQRFIVIMGLIFLLLYIAFFI